MTGHEIRQKFIDYFVAQGHRHVRSSSLVPHGDPTLLFTNAGMNQFKDLFLGLETRDYRRAVSSQKCVRAGGKHNDLENVGFTNRHHTFFEMLGNFSFGDYFKKEAIAYAWELVTSPQWFGISKDRLYATVFKGEAGIPRDEEAYENWVAQGVPRERIFEFGAKDNFWAMGDTGPCGPCSEIHYDMGPAASDQGHEDCAFGCECGRYVEIWNLVFMQYDRVSLKKQKDPNADFASAEFEETGYRLLPLPKPCVDTGMGLERLAAVLQGKISNFETDLFSPLIARASALTGVKYGSDPQADASLRIMADHARATAFLIADGVLPSNEGRGYVLRKIMRRAMRHAHLLRGSSAPFMTEMVIEVQKIMREAYPETVASGDIIRAVLAEQQAFARTVSIGQSKMEELIAEVVHQARVRSGVMPDTEFNFGDLSTEPLNPAAHQEAGIIRVVNLLKRHGTQVVFPGDRAFQLYDTFGLPIDFMMDATRDLGIVFDREGFDLAMEEQRERAKASWKGAHKEAANPVYAKLAETFRTEPDFYYGTHSRDCRIEAIVTKDGAVREIAAGVEAEVLLDRTVIYAESGGQVADTGSFWDNDQTMEVAEVRGAYYPVGGLIAHRIVAKEKLCVGDRVAVLADGTRREHVKRNHTGTHLAHAALRNILGTHVKQAGSLNDADRLRFDFSHFAAVDAAELHDIEQQVNEHILRNHEVGTDVLPLDAALASGALAFFGDKYPEQNVRVVTILDPASRDGFYSKELCGGTHVRNAGEVGLFKIVSEQSVAAGVRRIEAIAGERALEHYQRAAQALKALSQALNTNEDELLAAVERITQTVKQLEKQLEAVKRKAAHSMVDDLVEQARTVKDVRVLSARVPEVDRAGLRQLVDALRQKLGSGVVVLGTTEDGKVALITAVTKDLTSRLHAGKIVQAVAQQVGGSGGGRPDLAEAGGKDTSALEKAIGQVYEIVASML